MPALALTLLNDGLGRGKAALLDSVDNVFTGCPQLKVMRVTAWRIVAAMHDYHFVWNVAPVCQAPRNAMNALTPTIARDLRVLGPSRTVAASLGFILPARPKLGPGHVTALVE